MNISFSLAPKTYFAYTPNGEHKRSSKGIQHQAPLAYSDYYNTLYKDSKDMVENFVIRLHDGNMKSMLCKKAGLRNLVTKVYVKSDRVTTVPFEKLLK